MINRNYDTHQVQTWEEYAEETARRIPKTAQAQLDRITKQLCTMQKQGQFDEIETLFRLCKLMSRPNDDGELGRELGDLLRLHNKRAIGAERDVLSYLMQKMAFDLPCVK